MDKKVCVHCNKVNEHDKYVTCICNTRVHYECIHPYGSTPLPVYIFINNNSFYLSF